MKYILILLSLYSINSYCVEAYEISFIPFDLDFYNGTGPSDFEKREWSKKRISSIYLDKIFINIEKNCVHLPEFSPDLRVKITKTDGKKIFIDAEKSYFYLNKKCSIDNSLAKEILKLIDKEFSSTNKKTGSEMIKEKSGI